MNYGKKATMQLLRKYDNKSSKVKNKFKLIVLKILLVVVIVAGAAGISSGIGVMKGIIDSAPDISKIDVTTYRLLNYRSGGKRRRNRHTRRSGGKQAVCHHR